MKKSLFTLIILLCFLSTNTILAREDLEKTTITKIGQNAPDFMVITTDGKTIKMSELKGKVVMINFFADWCPPCKTEMPFLQKDIYNVFKDKNFYLISIARENTMDQVKKFRKEYNLSFAMAPDEDRSVYSLFAESYIPRNIIIDKKGKIIFQEIGFSEEKLKEMAEIISEELKK